MSNKPLVSIVFYQDKIQIVKLDNQKTKIEHAITLNLSSDLITNYQVQNGPELSKALKSTWKNQKISEKTVGIVVPEFSTFLKLTNVPKLENEELDEAIRWQSQEFLPTQNKNSVIDWKIVEEKEDSYDILVAAIQKETLAGFVDVVGQAGLMPVVVETPSLALVRSLTRGEPTLIIYIDGDETILVVAKQEIILGSSVIAVTDEKEVARTALLLLAHHQGVEVKSVLLGGAAANEKFISEIQTSLGRPASEIDIKLPFINQNLKQKYAIPLLLQFKETVDPNDTSTINLLPYASFPIRDTFDRFFFFDLAFWYFHCEILSLGTPVFIFVAGR